jgi:SAM-dependent methyltransferase
MGDGLNGSSLEKHMNLIEHNRRAWDRLSDSGILWAQPVSSELIERARNGDWSVSLSGRPVPRSWIGNVVNTDILCLASGGGQQAPILAAAGANVTSFDISEDQLQKDVLVARRDSLNIHTERGTMTDLSRFVEACFDLIFLPVAVNNVPDVRPVWKECFRILRPGGALLAGFINPSLFLFEENEGLSPDRGLTVINRLPYSEYESLSAEERRSAIERRSPFQWSHSLESLIGGQLEAGFVLTAFQENFRTDAKAPILNKFCPTYFATRAEKPLGK